MITVVNALSYPRYCLTTDQPVVGFQEALEVYFITAESTKVFTVSVSDRLLNSYEKVARSKMQIQVWFLTFSPVISFQEQLPDLA